MSNKHLLAMGMGQGTGVKYVLLIQESVFKLVFSSLPSASACDGPVQCGQTKAMYPLHPTESVVWRLNTRDGGYHVKHSHVHIVGGTDVDIIL